MATFGSRGIMASRKGNSFLSDGNGKRQGNKIIHKERKTTEEGGSSHPTKNSVSVPNFFSFFFFLTFFGKENWCEL